MRKLVLIAHVSLDGFVAGEGGSLAPFNPSPENLDFVCDITDGADAALMGRVSYEMLNTFWPTAWEKPNATASEIRYSKWYNAAQKIILSRTLPHSNTAQTSILSENIVEQVTAIKNQEGKSILLFGSPTSFRLLNNHDLVDQYLILVYPALFGKGVPLFVPGEPAKGLTVIETKQFTNGELAIHYKVNTGAA
ncbi:MAG: dihydrofolate reductase family protein [Niabella sp.]|nr:dihydrofolate reductase family protein [Niabella sp.]